MYQYKTEHNSFKYMTVFSLPAPHTNLSAQYKINHKYIGVTYDETKAVAISDQQYRTCQHANREFCRINAPFLPLTNPLSYVTSLYAKKDQAIKEQCSLIISHVPHTFILTGITSNLWIIPSNPQTLGICDDNNLPWKSYQHITPSATLPHIKVIPCMPCYI